MAPWNTFPQEYFRRSLGTVSWDFPNGISVWLKPIANRQVQTWIQINRGSCKALTPDLESLKELLWWIQYEHPSTGAAQLAADWHLRKAYKVVSQP